MQYVKSVPHTIIIFRNIIRKFGFRMLTSITEITKILVSYNIKNFFENKLEKIIMDKNVEILFEKR